MTPPHLGLDEYMTTNVLSMAANVLSTSDLRTFKQGARELATKQMGSFLTQADPSPDPNPNPNPNPNPSLISSAEHNSMHHALINIGNPPLLTSTAGAPTSHSHLHRPW